MDDMSVHDEKIINIWGKKIDMLSDNGQEVSTQ